MKIEAALELILQLSAAASKLAGIIANARAEGRTDLTDDELHSLIVENDAATAALATEIAKAKAKEAAALEPDIGA